MQNTADLLNLSRNRPQSKLSARELCGFIDIVRPHCSNGHAFYSGHRLFRERRNVRIKEAPSWNRRGKIQTSGERSRESSRVCSSVRVKKISLTTTTLEARTREQLSLEMTNVMGMANHRENLLCVLFSGVWIGLRWTHLVEKFSVETGAKSELRRPLCAQFLN